METYVRISTTWQPVLAAALTLSSGASLAQDEIIYVTAARVPVEAGDATSAVTLLDEAALDARGPVFLADILRASPGLAVSRSGSMGSLTQIRARGSEANHVLVLIDGVEAANPFTGEADFADFLFDDIGRVEVARGEQSALWGADAIGGVIALTTRRPGEGPDWGLRAEAGSFSSRRLTARYGYGAEAGDLTLSAGHFTTDSIDVSGTGGDLDGYQNDTVGLTGRHRFGAGWTVDGSLRWTGYEGASDADTDYDGLLDDTDNRREGSQVFARLGLTGETAISGITLDHRASLRLTDHAARTFSGGSRTGRTLGQRRGVAYQLTGRWSVGAVDHRLTGLLEQERDETKNDAGPGNGANQTREVETRAVAVDYGLSRGPLALTASARHENNDRFDDAFTWRIGAAWAVDAVDGRVRVSAGEAVKNPGVFELFGYFPDYFVGNPDLVPERSSGWEIGFEQSLADGAARWAVTWFDSELTDEIYTDFGVFPATARNANGVSTRRGVEVEGAADLSPAWSVFGSATWLESRADGAAEIRRPEHVASVTLDWHAPGSDFSGSLSADYTGEQRDTEFGGFTTVTLDAYTLVSGRLAWSVTPGIEAYIRGDNLLDEEYQDVYGYHTQGRGIYLGLRFDNGR